MFLYFQVYDLNGIKQSHDWAVSKYKEVQQRFSEEHPDFFGAKTIYTVPRLGDDILFITDLVQPICDSAYNIVLSR